MKKSVSGHVRTPQKELGDGVRPTEEPRQCHDTDKHWKSYLGFLAHKVLVSTLEATTQVRAEPVEMKNWDSPRQYRKKRLPSLHARRTFLDM